MVKELVEYMVRAIVEKPGSVRVEYKDGDESDFVEISVDQTDRGKVIGRDGQTIKALRVLVNQCLVRDKKIFIDLAQPAENV
ncbi:KH domain-containing protein [bacterium]|nr:MAG: KH domain-containing protein [bacterium]QQR62330.1 MAG: KH domain-containing protein [bacterium]QQR63380.1 MAG: KH domain-containing protein [bacterium]